MPCARLAPVGPKVILTHGNMCSTRHQSSADDPKDASKRYGLPAAESVTGEADGGAAQPSAGLINRDDGSSQRRVGVAEVCNEGTQCQTRRDDAGVAKGNLESATDRF